jgi:hypothetical protein
MDNLLEEMRAEAPRGRTPAELAPIRAQLMREMTATTTGTGPWQRRPRRRAVIAGVASTAGVAAAVVALTIGGTVPPSGHHPGAAVPVKLLSATEVLDHAAHAALAQPYPVPANGDFVDVRSETTFEAGVETKGGMSWWLYRAHRSIYRSVDGTKQGWLDETMLSPLPLGSLPIPPEAYQPILSSQWMPIPGPGANASIDDPTYPFLESLPTDPAALLAYIYAHRGWNQAWDEILNCLQEYLLPPKLRAAMFEAAAKIPGVSVVPGATDAAGRTGIAVSKVVGPSRYELIFNPRSYEYMGQRDVTVTAKPGVPAGTVTGSTAVLSITVVAAIPPHTAGVNAPSGK